MLGERLKHARERKGWSQRELARQAGVRHAIISELETGKKTDTMGSILKRLARALGVSVDYLLGGPGTMRTKSRREPPWERRRDTA